jgi:WD40 repeat protein
MMGRRSKSFSNVQRYFWWIQLLGGWLLLCLFAGHGQSLSPAASPTYADIAPILKDRCIVCHSQQNIKDVSISGGLALDSYEAIRKGVVVGKPHAILIPFKAAQSAIVRRIKATSPTLLMPKGGPPLPPNQIALIVRWINAGAPLGAVKATSSVQNVKAAFALRPLPSAPMRLFTYLPTHIKPPIPLQTQDKNETLEYALHVGPLPPIGALAFSNDGKTLAIGTYRAVVLWDVSNAKPLGCLRGLSGQVLSLAFHPSGKFLAVADGISGMIGEVRIFDLETEQPTQNRFRQEPDQITSLAFSLDGNRLAIGTQRHDVRVYDWTSGILIKTFSDAGDPVTKVRFSPDGRYLYAASMDHNIRRYDLNTGKLDHLYGGPEDGVVGLAVLPDGHRFISSSSAQRLRWWNADNGNTDRFVYGVNGPAYDIAISADGQRVLTTSSDGIARVWNGNGDFQRGLEGGRDWLYAAALTRDGKLAAAAGASGACYLWDANSGRLLASIVVWPEQHQVQWCIVTPQGYYAASPDWEGLVEPALHEQPLHKQELTLQIRNLDQPDQVQKVCQGTDLPVASITTAER